MYEFDINEVLKYFYEISKIPRMSGKEKKIADYVEKFAKERNLKYIRDIYNNVIIFKEATKCNKSNESIMLQCHLDMVCEKEEKSEHDFEKEGIDVYIEGDYIKAKDTTLGADNGIGIAIILAILNSNNIAHPKIEAIFTVQEETTMEGAKHIDVSMLKSKKMICLDSMNEEELWIGCAGAKILEYDIEGNKRKNDKDYALMKIELNGFRGGHSGKDISKNRGNPIKEMVNLLDSIPKKYNIYLKNIYGGRTVNVIPRECYTEIYIKKDDFAKIKKELLNYSKLLKEKSINDDEDINISIKEIEKIDSYSYDSNTTRKIIDIIKEIKDGVYDKDKYGNPLVSLNVGKIENFDNTVKIFFLIRTNKNEIVQKLEKELDDIVNKYKIQERKRELSGYEHKEKSMFIDTCQKIYRQYLRIDPKIINMHICLEAGFFSNKITGLDFIAISPNIYDAHSPKERCSISSLKKIYNYILLILKEI